MDYTQEQCKEYQEDYKEFLGKYNNLKTYIQSLQDNIPADLDPVLEEVMTYWEYYNAECRKTGFKCERDSDELAATSNRYDVVLNTTTIHVLRANPKWDYRYELRVLDTIYDNLVDKYKMFLDAIEITQGE
nr:MAG TPA: hypothetical protein [Caudoviricetes sp.]